MKIAYITLATTPRYLKGAHYLYKSYLLTKSQYPFYCMVPPLLDTSVQPDVPTITVPYIDAYSVYSYDNHHPCIDYWNKINAMNLTQFDFVLLMDADCIFLNNIDDTVTRQAQFNADLVGYLDHNEREGHFINAQWLLVKPSKKFYDAVIYYLYNKIDNPNDTTEQSVLYWMAKDNQITFIDDSSLADYLKHEISYEHEKKYWETEEGLERYNRILALQFN